MVRDLSEHVSRPLLSSTFCLVKPKGLQFWAGLWAMSQSPGKGPRKKGGCAGGCSPPGCVASATHTVPGPWAWEVRSPISFCTRLIGHSSCSPCGRIPQEKSSLRNLPHCSRRLPQTQDCRGAEGRGGDMEAPTCKMTSPRGKTKVVSTGPEYDLRAECPGPCHK